MASEKSLLTVSRPELLDRGSDRRFRGLLHDLFAFGSILEAARARFAEQAGLSPAQYLALIAIAQSSPREPAGVGEIARHLHLSGAFVTIEVNKLVAEGLVAKQPHPTDGRRVRLTLTEAGAARLERLAELQRPVNDALFETLAPEEFARLAEVMSRLVAGGASALALADHLRARQDAAAD